MAEPLRVLLDCDPGIDDAVSLMAALASPDEFDIAAITTVAGNVPVELATENALKCRELAARFDVPVHAGCARPMVREPVFADFIHGESGLGHAELPQPAHPAETQHAVDTIIAELRAADDASVTLVPTGPLTNLGVALVMAPDITRAIKQIVIMGGAGLEGGNITPSAEFNMYADPHAAHHVLTCGRPITLIGLDATLQLRCTPARMDQLLAADNRASRAAHAMITHVNTIYGEVYGAEGAALHDPCTIGYLLAPELFETKPCHVEVVTEDPVAAGHTAVDRFCRGDRVANVDWVEKLEAAALFDLIAGRLGRLA